MGSKLPPSEVIVHRIEFQQKERELIESLVGAIQFKQIGEPILDIFTDPVKIGTLAITTAALLELLGVVDFIPDSLKYDIRDGIFATVEAAVEQVQGVIDAAEVLVEEGAEVVGGLNVAYQYAMDPTWQDPGLVAGIEAAAELGIYIPGFLVGQQPEVFGPDIVGVNPLASIAAVQEAIAADPSIPSTAAGWTWQLWVRSALGAHAFKQKFM